MSDGTYEDYSEVYIEGASNYGEEVTIPETVKYDGKSYVITKLRDVFRDSKIINLKSATIIQYTIKGRFMSR